MRGRSFSPLATIARLSVPYCQVGQDAWDKTLVSQAFCCCMPSLSAYINHASFYFNALLPQSAHSLSSPPPPPSTHPLPPTLHPPPRHHARQLPSWTKRRHDAYTCSTHTLHVPHPCPVVSIRNTPPLLHPVPLASIRCLHDH